MGSKVSQTTQILLLVLVGCVLISNVTALTCYTCAWCDTVNSNTNTTADGTKCYYCQKIWVNYLFFTGTHRGCMTKDNDCNNFDDRFWGMGRMGSCCKTSYCNDATSNKSMSKLALLGSMLVTILSMPH